MAIILHYFHIAIVKFMFTVYNIGTPHPPKRINIVEANETDRRDDWAVFVYAPDTPDPPPASPKNIV